MNAPGQAGSEQPDGHRGRLKIDDQHPGLDAWVRAVEIIAERRKRAGAGDRAPMRGKLVETVHGSTIGPT